MMMQKGELLPLLKGQSSQSWNWRRKIGVSVCQTSDLVFQHRAPLIAENLQKMKQMKKQKKSKKLESTVNSNSPFYKSSPCPCIPWSQLHPNIQTCRRVTRRTKFRNASNFAKMLNIHHWTSIFPTNHTLASRLIKPVCLSQERIGRALGCCTFQAHLYLSPVHYWFNSG